MKQFLFGSAFIGAALLQSVPAQAQLTQVDGDVEQSVDIPVILAVAAGPLSTASIYSSSVVAGATIHGSVRQSSSGKARIAVAAPLSQATIVESTVCGNVQGDVRMASHVGTIVSASIFPGSSTRVMIASSGRGTTGPVSTFVSGGTLIATDIAPRIIPRTIRIGSVGGRSC